MSTRKKVNEAGDGTVINEGTIDPTLPPIEAPLPLATDTPSDGQAVAAEFVEAESITATAKLLATVVLATLIKPSASTSSALSRSKAAAFCITFTDSSGAG